ncbi:MAG: serine acetyltransferase [Gammaproteobacteria bacterium]|jgi:serine O-acetyltransferase|nr:MAG: serine acetyltransferase [Gammaproteobacteria bacterium]
MATKQHLWFPLIRQDLGRYFDPDQGANYFKKAKIFLDTPGLQATLVYRFGFWVERKVSSVWFRLPLKLLYYFLDKAMVILWGIHIDPLAEIGGGLYIGHYGGVLIGPVRVGTDCNINHQVTMGLRADGIPGVPTIGNRVWIGAGSILFGAIRVGDGATIGPLTVVSRSLPNNVLVGGNPMRLVRKNYDNSALLRRIPE